MAVGNCRADIGLGQQGGLGQPAIEGQVAGHGSSKSAASSVSRIGTLALGFEYLLFNSMFCSETQQVNCLIQMATCDDQGSSTHVVKLGGGRLHFIQFLNFHSGNGCGLIDIGGDHVRQWNEPLDHDPGSGSVQKIGSGGGLKDGI